MNKKLITTYGQQIHSYKLKTKRQKKQSAKKGIAKKIIALYKEQCRLIKIKNNLPLMLLKEPYQRGWQRTFILRDDVARSGSADFFKNILNKINNIEYSTRKDFKKRKRQKGRKVFIVKEQYVSNLLPYEFVKLNFTNKEAVFFIKALVHNTKTRRFEEHFVFTEPWRFVLKTSPNIITHTKMIDADLESAIAEINKRIDKNYLYPKIDKARSKNHQFKYYDYDNPKYEYNNNKNVNDWLFEISQQ